MRRIVFVVSISSSIHLQASDLKINLYDGLASRPKMRASSAIYNGNSSDAIDLASTYLESIQKQNNLKNAKMRLRNEEIKVEERKTLGVGGFYIQADDYESTVWNFKNGHATMIDVFKSEAEHLNQFSSLQINSLTFTRDEVLQLEKDWSEANKLLRELLNTFK